MVTDLFVIFKELIKNISSRLIKKDVSSMDYKYNKIIV